MHALKNFGLLGTALLLMGAGVYLGNNGPAGYDLMAFLAAAVVFCAQIVWVSPRRGTLAASVLAMGCNAYLLYRKFEASGESACNISQTINCDIVNQSAASEMFGIPITLFGVAFYGGLAVASLMPRAKAPRFDQISGLFAIVTLAYSAYLGWEAKQLGALCVMCITIYACNALLLWAALAALKEHGASLFSGVDKIFGDSSLWLITAVFAVVTLVGASSWSTDSHGTGVPSAKLETPADLTPAELASMYTRPRGTIETDGTEPVLGNREAKYSVLEFADYACPHCALASPELKALIEENSDTNLTFKAFPLTSLCNPGIERDDGPGRCKAAMAAECAGVQDRYFEMSSMIFKNIGYNSDSDLAFMAKELPIDFPRWEECMADPATVEAVVADAVAGLKAEISGTPAIFVKGLIGDGAWVEITQGPESVAALIDAHRNGASLPIP